MKKTKPETKSATNLECFAMWGGGNSGKKTKNITSRGRKTQMWGIWGEQEGGEERSPIKEKRLKKS